MSYPAPPPARTGIEVTTGFFPLAFLLFMCSPVVVINGHPIQHGWRTAFYDLQPGQYQICIFFSYLGMSQCGRADVALALQPGEWRRVNFYMWPWMFAPGSISVS
ncbi:MAG: hypothetical protein SFU86_12650 [Pirellulaceae bacterium]|nr:hypothetical protein [Pirellulaceae bacterium]